MMKWSYGMPMRFFHFCLLLSIRFKNQKSKKNVETRPPQAECMHRKRRGVCSRSSTVCMHKKKPGTRVVNDSELSSPNNSTAPLSKTVQASSMTAPVAFCTVVDGAIPLPCTQRETSNFTLHADHPTSRFPLIIRLPAGQPLPKMYAACSSVAF